MLTFVKTLIMNLSKLLTKRECCLLVCLLLALGVWLGFGRAIQYDFINYDDDVFVYNNTLVTHGLTVQGLVDAVTRINQIFYYPLSTISLMLDSAVYGLNPFGFHLTNVLLHMGSSILLFLILQKMTGSIWRSALVAAFFAVHPLRVESVVWITERKDVLSGLFFMLTLCAYLSYVRHPFSKVRYAAVFLFYLAGLMSKPMLVSLPFVLLLLDWWPLGRFSRRVFYEKIPLLIMSAVFCAVTLMAASGGRSVIDENIPFSWRISNALVSCIVYIRQMLFPAGLALPYPAKMICFAEAGSALLFLSAFSIVAVLLRRKKPYLLTGWLWYLGMLVPVLGVFRVLGTARADRFTYLPQIGLCILLVWAVADWCISARRRALLSVFSILVFTGLVAATRNQCTYWSDSETLWRHTLANTEKNSVAHSNLGEALFLQGRTRESIQHFEEAIRLGTKQAEVYNNLGFALADTGDYDGAVRSYVSALSIDPDRAEIIKNLADTFVALGDTGRAVRLYELAVDKKPDYVDALKRAACIFASGADASFRNGGRAVVLAERANVLCDGRDTSVLCVLAAAYAEAGQFSKAVDVTRKAAAIAMGQDDKGAVKRILHQLSLYERQEPYHEAPVR